MKLRALTCAVLISTIALGCSSEHANEESANHNDSAATSEHHEAGHNEARTGTGPGTGTGSLSGENTANAGTHGPADHNGEGAVENGGRMIATGTGTSPAVKKPDTLRGKWPSQANPYY